MRSFALALVLVACNGSSPEAPAAEPRAPEIPRIEVGPPEASGPAVDADATDDPDAALAANDANAADVVDAAVDAAPKPFDRAAWERSTIYFVLTDRFANGDPSNDGDEPCTDRSHPRRFHGGDLDGLAARLPYLAELGVDAIWITPVQKQIGRRGDACGYHGYWADLDDPDDAAIEPRLGGEAALDRLLSAMHARGMRLVVDLVVNHAGYGARIVGKRPDWFHGRDCAEIGDPELTCPLSGLPDFAQEKPQVADYLDDLSRRFVARFPFDGIRMDTVKHVPASYFRDRWIPTVRSVRPLYLLGELFDEDLAKYQRYLEAGFDGLFHFPLRSALVTAVAKGGSLDAVATAIGRTTDRVGQARARMLSTFVDNHDLPRFPSEIEGFPSAERADRHRIALGILFTAPGIPKLQYGNELGMAGTYPGNRRDFPSTAFDPATRDRVEAGDLEGPATTFAWVRDLASLRRSIRPLHAGDYVELWRPGGGANVWVFLRATPDGDAAIVVVHLGVRPLAGLSVPFATNSGVPAAVKSSLGPLRERFGRATSNARLEGGRLIVDAAPRSIAIFTP
jgi:glycosidase